jgi:hypothetical protein
MLESSTPINNLSNQYTYSTRSTSKRIDEPPIRPPTSVNNSYNMASKALDSNLRQELKEMEDSSHSKNIAEILRDMATIIN